MKETKKNIYIVGVIGTLCYLGIFVAMPTMFTENFYIITGIFTLFLLSLIIKINSQNTKVKRKSKNKNKRAGYDKKSEPIQQDISSITTYIETLSSVEENEVNENEVLYLLRKENSIDLYSKYWHKIGYCKENLSKMLMPMIDRGNRYEGIVLDVSGSEDLQIEVRIVKVHGRSNVNSYTLDLDSEFATTIVGVNSAERQDAIRNLKKFGKINLIREADNEYNGNAISVYNSQDIKLGYLKKELTESLAPLIDSGEVFTSKVSKVIKSENSDYELKIKIKKVNGLNEIDEESEISEGTTANELMQYNILGYFKDTSNTKIAKDILYVFGRQPQMLIYDIQWMSTILMVCVMNIVKKKYSTYIEYPTGKELKEIDDRNEKKEVIKCYEIYNNILNNIYRWEYSKESDSNSSIYHPNYGLVSNEFILEEVFRPISPISYTEFHTVSQNILSMMLKEYDEEEYKSAIDARLNNIKKIISDTKTLELKNIKKQWIEELNQRKMFLTEIEWNGNINNIKSRVDVGLESEEISDHLYEDSLYCKSDYVCPECNDHLLYKIKIEGVYTVFNHTDKLPLFNLYTCQHCRRFYASIKTSTTMTDTKLCDFALKSSKYSENKYTNLIRYTEKLHNNDFSSLDI